MTHAGCDVTCRETPAGHPGVFGGVAPLRCVLGARGWNGERDSCQAMRSGPQNNLCTKRNRTRPQIGGATR